MPRVSPFHSVKPVSNPVYHDNSACYDGNNIEPYYHRYGTGNRRRCATCDRLAAERR